MLGGGSDRQSSQKPLTPKNSNFKEGEVNKKGKEVHSTVIAPVGQLSAASFAHSRSVSGTIALAFPSSSISKTSGQMLAQTPHPMHVSLSTLTFISDTSKELQK
jgi:hypothetical protein